MISIRKPTRPARAIACAVGLVTLAAVAASSPQVVAPVQVTTGSNDQGDINPTWAPGGTRVTYESRDLSLSYPSLFYKDMPGGSETQFAGSGELFPDYEQPRYSPDGLTVAYSKRDGEWHHIYVRPASGGSESAITTGAAGPTGGLYGDVDPAWSPDGQWIAFSSARADPTFGMYDIWVVKANGTGLVRITTPGAGDTGWPTWSADGSHVVYSQNNEVWQVSKSGGGWGTPGMLWDGGNHPSFSPSGKHIAYDNGGDIQVRAYGPPVGSPVSITSDAYLDWGACWSPDGRALAFSSNRGNGYRAIWVANGVDQVPTIPVTLGRLKAAYR
jgi:Tol biopolymer transport system component